MMKRLVFLVEGDPNQIDNFSGIPYFFTKALLRQLQKIQTPMIVVDTSDLLNVEELLTHAKHTITPGGLVCQICNSEAILYQRKRESKINRKLFRQLSSCKTIDEFIPVVASYYDEVALDMRRRLNEILREGDIVLSQNYLYPFTGNDFPIAYYIDASLVEFYFDERHGVLPAEWRSSSVKEVFHRMEHLALAGSPVIFCFSDALQRSLQSSLDIVPERLVVAGAGVNLPRFPRLRVRTPSPVLQLLFVGLDFTRKGGSELLEALDQLRDTPVHLLVITHESHFPQQPPPNVTFVPPCTKEELCRYYETADAFVFPTLFEPFGLVVPEAMAYSLPVIAYNTFAMPEILGTHSVTLMVDRGDLSGLIAAIRFLVECPDKRLYIGRRNYARSKRYFQWQHAARRIVMHFSDSNSVDRY